MVDLDTMFRVNISGEQETSKRCHLKGAYHLMVKDSSLCLCDLTSSLVLYEWPYNTIRRYGVTSHSFQFEAGRRSSSGEGVFAMDTNQSFQIFKAVEGIWKTPKESSALSGSVTCSDGELLILKLLKQYIHTTCLHAQYIYWLIFDFGLKSSHICHRIMLCNGIVYEASESSESIVLSKGYLPVFAQPPLNGYMFFSLINMKKRRRSHNIYS